jgi:hypothetical protein
LELAEHAGELVAEQVCVSRFSGSNIEAPFVFDELMVAVSIVGVGERAFGRGFGFEPVAVVIRAVVRCAARIRSSEPWFA